MRSRWVKVLGVVLAGLLVIGAAVLVRNIFFGPKTIAALFTTATGIYPGDDVRVSGVKVGTIKAIEPEGTQTKLVLAVDRDVPIPADVGPPWAGYLFRRHNVPRPGRNDPNNTNCVQIDGTTLVTTAAPLPAYAPCPLFQDRPNWQTGCGWPDTGNNTFGYARPHLSQNPHAGGMNVGLGDGSVRTVSRGISASTWARVCDPRDGETKGPSQYPEVPPGTLPVGIPADW